MISYDNAISLIEEHTISRKTVKTDIVQSIGSISAEDVFSPLNMPPFNKSAMDGYAVRSEECQELSVSLKCVGIIEAGESFTDEIGHGECVKIMTGAPVPETADSVIKVEDTSNEGDNIRIHVIVKKNAHICFRGEDIKKDQLILKKGTLLHSSHIALLASTGRSTIHTFRKPDVAIINTGGEILSPGEEIRANAIFNSNGPQLAALLKNDTIQFQSPEIVRDEMTEIMNALKKSIESDILLISGGVSMGDYDLIPDALQKFGVKKIFHNVKIKPGKPLFFGTFENKIVFGIPGNPVSNFAAYHLFIKPAILKMMGYDRVRPVFQEGIVTADFMQNPGRKHFFPVKIQKKDNTYLLEPINSHGSADILSLSHADGFMIVEENIAFIKNGTSLKFLTWK